MAVSVNPQLLRAIRTKVPRAYQPLVLATAIVESGGNPYGPPGDHGQSFGAYQEYTGGRGAGLTPAQRRDPVGSTQRAWREFSSLSGKYRGPELAYRAQRPADHAGYVQKIKSALPTAQQILSAGAGASAPPSGATPALRAAQLQPVAGSLDAHALMRVLNKQRERSLRGLMPTPAYGQQLQKIAQQAYPRGQVQAATDVVRQAVAPAATSVANASFPGLTARQDPGKDGLYGFRAGGVDSGLAFRGGVGGDWGGSMPRALALARAVGATPSSEKRSRKLTASGHPSDHWIGMTSSYATDLPTSGAAGDALLRRISQALGVQLKAGTWNNVNIGGYRYQVGWRVPGHFDHVHVGVRKL
jgi:hypothetical protein